MAIREEMRSLAQDISGSYEDRMSALSQLRDGAKAQLKEFDEVHQAATARLRADLARSERLRRAQGLKQDLVRGVSERRQKIAEQLKGFASARDAAAKELGEGLAKVRPTLVQGGRRRQGEAQGFREGLARTVAKGKAALKAQLQEWGEIMAGARAEWHKLTATLQAKRGMATAEARPLAAKSPPAEEAAQEEASPEEASPELVVLRNQAFEYLVHNPDGTKMTQLEQALGMPRIKMAQALRGLLDEGKVEKRGLFYFAT